MVSECEKDTSEIRIDSEQLSKEKSGWVVSPERLQTEEYQEMLRQTRRNLGFVPDSERGRRNKVIGVG